MVGIGRCPSQNVCSPGSADGACAVSRSSIFHYWVNGQRRYEIKAAGDAVCGKLFDQSGPEHAEERYARGLGEAARSFALSYSGCLRDPPDPAASVAQPHDAGVFPAAPSTTTPLKSQSEENSGGPEFVLGLTGWQPRNAPRSSRRNEFAALKTAAGRVFDIIKDRNSFFR